MERRGRGVSRTEEHAVVPKQRLRIIAVQEKMFRRKITKKKPGNLDPPPSSLLSSALAQPGPTSLRARRPDEEGSCPSLFAATSAVSQPPPSTRAPSSRPSPPTARTAAPPSRAPARETCGSPSPGPTAATGWTRREAEEAAVAVATLEKDFRLGTEYR